MRDRVQPPLAEWGQLARALRQQYPLDWHERFRSYVEGTNPDLNRWRQLGTERAA